jgi:hypothetical protein
MTPPCATPQKKRGTGSPAAQPQITSNEKSISPPGLNAKRCAARGISPDPPSIVADTPISTELTLFVRERIDSCRIAGKRWILRIARHLRRPLWPISHNWRPDFVGEPFTQRGLRYGIGVAVRTGRDGERASLLYCRPRHLQKTRLALRERGRKGPRVSRDFAGAKRFRPFGHLPRLAGNSPKAYYYSIWDISLSRRNLGGAL